jgi:hypothetical protein
MKKKSSFRKTTGNAAKVGRDGLDDSPKGTGKAAALRQKERRRLRAQRTPRLRKYGALAALGIAATLAVVLPLSNRGKPADAGDARPKDAPASSCEKPVGASGAGNGSARRGNEAGETIPQKTGNVTVDVLTINGKKYHGVKINTDKKDSPKINAAQGDMPDGFAEYLKKHGMSVEESGIGPGVIGQSRIPSNTVRVYRNTAQPPEAEARPQTDEGDASR